MRFSLLGAVSMRIGETAVSCGPPQQQATLAALLLRAGQVVASHQLIDAVWGEDPPESAVRILRTYVWRIRKELSAADGEQPLVSVGDGYRLMVPASSVDALHAEQLASAFAQVCRAGRHDTCGELLDEADALWRGEPLAGVPGPFAASERARLTELRLMLLEERFEHDLRRGRHLEAVSQLAALSRRHPLRERFHASLIRALAASGRRADALAAYARARKALREELGLEPGAELRALHQSLLHDADLDTSREGGGRDGHDTRPGRPAPATVAPAFAAPDPAKPQRGPSPPNRLPAGAADFCGREDLVAELCQALTAPGAGPRVVSLTGMAGIGKSTLALRVGHLVARHFPDGQLFADLSATGPDATDPGTALAGLLLTLGAERRSLPSLLEERSALLRKALRGRRVLLLLDDAREAAQVEPFLPDSDGCAVLVTSRSTLTGLPGGVHVPLTEFTTAEAVAMVRAIVGRGRVDREEAEVVRLVAGCARLPLAVRVIATRLASRPAWTVADLVSCLTDEQRRLRELYAEEMALTAAFELSYCQLSREQASAFRSLAAVARPSIGLPAAAAALGVPQEQAGPLLESLVDIALLESPMPGRYRYHDLVQGFALRLPGHGDSGERQSPVTGTDHPCECAAAVQRRLLRHLLRTAAAAFHQMVPGDPVHRTLAAECLSGQPPLFDDLTAARAWVTAEFQGAVHLVQLLLKTRGPADAAPLTEAADLLVALSAFGQDIPYTQMAQAARRLAEAAERQGAHRAAGRARFVCGNAALQSARLARAGLHIRLAAEACSRAGDDIILRQTYNDLGVIAYWEGRYDEATTHFEQAVELARTLGLRSGELNSAVNAALARIRSGRAEEALSVCEQALAALQEMTDHQGVAHALCVRGQALHALGRYDLALAGFVECLDTCEAVGNLNQQAQARYHLARTLGALGRPDAALAEAERAVAHFRTDPGMSRHLGHALLAHAEALSARGQAAAARAQAQEAVRVFTTTGLADAAQARELAARMGAGAEGSPAA